MKHQLHIRLILACAALFAALALFTPESARAQVDCRCDSVTVAVDPGVQCVVHICAETPNGVVHCASIGPGLRLRVPCVPGSILYFIDCHGLRVPYDPGNGCLRGIGAGPNCCVIDACLERDLSGCPVIKITPSILDVCPCL